MDFLMSTDVIKISLKYEVLIFRTKADRNMAISGISQKSWKLNLYMRQCLSKSFILISYQLFFHFPKIEKLSFYLHQFLRYGQWPLCKQAEKQTAKNSRYVMSKHSYGIITKLFFAGLCDVQDGSTILSYNRPQVLSDVSQLYVCRKCGEASHNF